MCQRRSCAKAMPSYVMPPNISGCARNREVRKIQQTTAPQKTQSPTRIHEPAHTTTFVATSQCPRSPHLQVLLELLGFEGRVSLPAAGVGSPEPASLQSPVRHVPLHRPPLSDLPSLHDFSGPTGWGSNKDGVGKDRSTSAIEAKQSLGCQIDRYG